MDSIALIEPRPKAAPPRADTPSSPRLKVRRGKDARFCAMVMARGGLPRAEVIEGRTVWLGPDGKPWREIKR